MINVTYGARMKFKSVSARASDDAPVVQPPTHRHLHEDGVARLRAEARERRLLPLLRPLLQLSKQLSMLTSVSAASWHKAISAILVVELRGEEEWGDIY